MKAGDSVIGDRLLFVIHALCAVALAAALFVACEPLPSPMAPCIVGAFASPCAPRLERAIAISPRFTRAQREAILNGAALWEVASGGAVRFEVCGEGGRCLTPITIEPGSADGFVAVTRRGRNIIVDVPRVEEYVGLAGVTAHELGHAMGLDHSIRPDDIMAPNVHPCMVITQEDLRQLERALEEQGL